VLAIALTVAGLWSLLVRPADSGAAQPAAANARFLALALLLGLGLVPAVWLYSQVRSVYDPRYLGICLPEFAILLAAGIGWLGRAVDARVAARRVAGALVPLVVAVLTVAMALENGLAIDRFRSEQAVDPAREVAARLVTEVRPGDVVMTLNAQSYFPLDYYLVRSGEAARLGVELYHWHRPTAAFFTGWEDIDPARVIDQPRIDALGWSRALGLSPTSRIWLVTLTDPAYEFPRFEPAQTGALRVADATVVTGSGGTAEIWETVPGNR
jgi:hypothetical protein